MCCTPVPQSSSFQHLFIPFHSLIQKLHLKNLKSMTPADLSPLHENKSNTTSATAKAMRSPGRYAVQISSKNECKAGHRTAVHFFVRPAPPPVKRCCCVSYTKPEIYIEHPNFVNAVCLQLKTPTMGGDMGGDEGRRGDDRTQVEDDKLRETFLSFQRLLRKCSRIHSKLDRPRRNSVAECC